MALQEKNLYTKRSQLPGAGKGLFTRVFIPKGTRIVEYKGEVLTWKEAEKMPEDRNGYVFFFTNNYVIDAWKHKGFAHFANDAKGIARVEGLKNNSEYETEKKRCFIVATRDIPARSEILVGYGGEYWQAIRYNVRIEAERIAKEGKKSKSLLPHEILKKSKKKKMKK
ncbi:MAG: SET domain-containing protein [Cyclobacteriaceae bacterium]|nr:SET domain-containing protein [Cyclobacteriaceae bacterium]